MRISISKYMNPCFRRALLTMVMIVVPSPSFAESLVGKEFVVDWQKKGQRNEYFLSREPAAMSKKRYCYSQQDPSSCSPAVARVTQAASVDQGRQLLALVIMRDINDGPTAQFVALFDTRDLTFPRCFGSGGGDGVIKAAYGTAAQGYFFVVEGLSGGDSQDGSMVRSLYAGHVTEDCRYTRLLERWPSPCIPNSSAKKGCNTNPVKALIGTDGVLKLHYPEVRGGRRPAKQQRDEVIDLHAALAAQKRVK